MCFSLCNLTRRITNAIRELPIPGAVANRGRVIGDRGDQDVTPCRISEVHSVRVFANSRSSSAPSPTPILTMTQLFNKQGSDLIELRLTWREMENYIFGGFFRIFRDIHEYFWHFFEDF